MNKRIILTLIMLTLGLSLRLWWISTCNYHPGFHWTDYSKGYNLIEQDSNNIYATQVGTKPPSEWFKGVSTDFEAPQIRRAIGWPLFLGVFYRLFGASYGVLIAVNLALQIGTGICLWWLIKRVFGEVPAWLGVATWAILPVSIYSSALCYDEHLFIFLWVLGICLLMRRY